MPPDEHRRSIPISCRFVPYDQWLLTHVQNDWNVKQVKHWILSKCNLVRAPDVPTQRSVSPIFFASPCSRTGYTLGRYDEAEGDPEYNSIQRDKESPGQISRPSNKLGNNRLVDQYVLIAFSTGRVLQNDDTMSSCNLRPYELVEMHRSDMVVPLHRKVVLEYVQPYFHARVRALLAAWSPKAGRFKLPGKATEHELGVHGKKREIPITLRWKPKLEWKDRWVVIHKDILSLSKDESGVALRHQFSLPTLKALRGADSLQRTCAIVGDQRVICLKFRTTRSITLPMTAPSTTSSEGWKTDTSRATSDQVSSASEKATGKRRFRKPRQPYNPDDICRGEGEWVVLDMLDDYENVLKALHSAFANMLRVLHRYAPKPVSSSFLPSSALGNCCPTVPTTSSLNGRSSKSIPYPEWRVDIAETARKASTEDITKPLSWGLRTEIDCGSLLSDNSDFKHHDKSWQDMYHQIGVIPDCYRTGSEPMAESASDEADSDSNSVMDSELEWEGWMNDLNRQTCAVSEKVHSPSSISSSLPSLLSETSSARTRERSYPITLPNLGATTSSVRSFDERSSGRMSQRTDSSEVLRESADAAHTLGALKTITVHTVSPRAPPSPPRRRSLTVSPDGSAKLTQNFCQFTRGQPLTVSSATGAHASLRTLSDVGLLKDSAGTTIRHARSISSLRSPSSPCCPDISEGLTCTPLTPPSPNTPSKRKHSFLRGAEKLIRGLDSALDIRDAKPV
ncbi:hypothetical protein M404DRAFT_11639 [Pisolithus tinctorius Marx 270]|uniref:Uncharacterized protein n=1 Tax=Pisolithus tinctorius Marx 270 TaxID=870435 RepID=A0A0C3PZ86_PISTI|nr:hypothetical protein M404DRAFT_11639 [Pisolithus tinctorius Marx 270]